VKPVRYAPEAEEESIHEHPGSWGPPPGVAPEVGARRVLVRGFPFGLVYVELEEEIRVIAVAHSRRRPGYWRDRV
jgi:toxin ParE1/3/4